MDQNDNDNKNIDLALQLSIKKIETQNQAHDSLESKIGILLGFVGIIAGSVIILIQQNTDLVGLNIFTLGLILIYLALILLVFASQTRTYLDPPDFPAFYSKESLSQSNGAVKNQIIADIKGCHEQNAEPHAYKSKLFNFAIYSFLISILLLFLGILEK